MRVLPTSLQRNASKPTNMSYNSWLTGLRDYITHTGVNRGQFPHPELAASEVALCTHAHDHPTRSRRTNNHYSCTNSNEFQCTARGSMCMYTCAPSGAHGRCSHAHTKSLKTTSHTSLKRSQHRRSCSGPLPHTQCKVLVLQLHATFSSSLYTRPS
jgi:hypothetical protein